MILFDVTKAAASRHASGLQRVSARLREELGAACSDARWPDWRAGKGDWILTAELFSEAERPGIAAFLERRPCRCAAVFHDAIPLQLPEITWPRSVARHPGYLRLLARFDRVWAVSEASRRILLDLWRWQGVEAPPPVEVLALGADFDRRPRPGAGARPAERRLVCTGILEPRKNQELLLDACEDLWGEGLDFELHLVGRVNPHFGRATAERVRRLARRRPLRWHREAEDAEVAELYEGARGSAFPTRAEGCGLPLIESLWKGTPCVCSDLPVLRENAAGGGCVPVPAGDRGAWKAALRRILEDDAWQAKLAAEARSRPLPTWKGAAEALLKGLAG